MLTSFAELIAQPQDRARLYGIKRQLARTLRSGLLPRGLPHVLGPEVAAPYRPADRGMDIGGDFYDLVRRGEATAAAAVGDVQGHSMTGGPGRPARQCR